VAGRARWVRAVTLKTSRLPIRVVRPRETALEKWRGLMDASKAAGVFFKTAEYGMRGAYFMSDVPRMDYRCVEIRIAG
jgi:hypothetical protein